MAGGRNPEDWLGQGASFATPVSEGVLEQIDEGIQG